MNAKRYKSKILLITVIIICISVVLLYVFSSSIREIVDIVFISFALSYVLNPSKEFFMRKLKINGKAASVIVIFIVAGIIFGGAAVILPSFVEELSSAGDIFDNVADFYKDIAEKFNLNDIPVLDSLYNSIMEKGSSLWLKFSADLLDNILKISSKIVSLAVMPVMIYYFMCDSDCLLYTSPSPRD